MAIRVSADLSLVAGVAEAVVADGLVEAVEVLAAAVGALAVEVAAQAGNDANERFSR